MNSKKGIELSLNMIIIVVIAVVFLGIAIALIVDWGERIGDEVPKIFPPSTTPVTLNQNDPVQVTPQPLSVDRGDSSILELYVYNYAPLDVECTLVFTPATAETPLTITHSKANRPIPMNMAGQWLIDVEAPRNAPTGLQLYTVNVNCGEFTQQEDFAIQIE